MANDQTMRLRSNLAHKKNLSNKKSNKTKVFFLLIGIIK